MRRRLNADWDHLKENDDTRKILDTMTYWSCELLKLTIEDEASRKTYGASFRVLSGEVHHLSARHLDHLLALVRFVGTPPGHYAEREIA